jgi:hypothetical protein
MCNQVEVIRIVFHEVKGDDGKWTKTSRAFMSNADAVREIETLQEFAKQRRPFIRKVVPEPMLTVLYPTQNPFA